MSTNTYDELRTVTVSSSTASITLDLTGISGYTDLVLVGQYGSTVSEDYLQARFNTDANTNYSTTSMLGNSSNASAGRSNNRTEMFIDWNSSAENALTKNCIVSIMNYASTTHHKYVHIRNGRATTSGNATYTGTEVQAGLWRKAPEAITTILLKMATGSILTGSRFSLYGIKAWAPEATPKATGGYVSQDSSYWYHAFPFSSTFTPNQSLTADILVVAGGGAGGGNPTGNSNVGRGGGGGAGGLLYFASQSLVATNYGVTVGAGGGGGTVFPGAGTNGSNSQFASLTASVGGGGGGVRNGSSGGSGGGAGTISGAGTVGTGTTGQGNNGGGGTEAPPQYGSGGGGGAGSAGTAGTADKAGNGGIGTNTYSTWATVTQTGIDGYYAGGGGGAAYGDRAFIGIGGLGGGGNGAADNVGGTGGVTAIHGISGAVSTGGGGGGGTDFWEAGNGGSGIVIVRYAK